MTYSLILSSFESNNNAVDLRTVLPSLICHIPFFIQVKEYPYILYSRIKRLMTFIWIVLIIDILQGGSYDMILLMKKNTFHKCRFDYKFRVFICCWIGTQCLGVDIDDKLFPYNMLTLFSKCFGCVYGIKCLCVNVMKWILVRDNLFNSNDKRCLLTLQLVVVEWLCAPLYNV